MRMTKLLYFLRLEPTIQLGLVLVSLLAALGIAQWCLLQGQERKLAQVGAEQNLIGRIDEMKKSIEARKAALPLRPVVDNPSTLDLQGTFIRGRVYYALINGKVYKRGDRLGDYYIIEITKISVLMGNKKIKGVTRLKLP